jgi:diguanylate cyclase (GGDEF)-like protein
LVDHAVKLEDKARKRRLVGFAAMVAIGLMFAGTIVNSFRVAASARQAEAWQVHSLDVLLIAARLESGVNKALRGQRGYQITGDRTYLATYLEGGSDAVQLARSLRSLTRDNRLQQRQLVAVDACLAAYLASLSSLVALNEAGRNAEAVASVRGGTGRRQITDLLGALHRIEAEELRLLGVRAAESRRASERIETYNWLLAGAGALVMALLAATVIGAARGHQRRLDLTAELEHLAATDMLTGLPNRRQLMAAMDVETSRAGRTGRPLSLALIDIDHFKRVNDRHGHPSGDAVLCQVAEVLREVTRGGDVLGRFGGEEFAVLMPETEIEQAQWASERLRKAIEGREMRFPGGGSGHVTVSTGVALLAGDEDCDQLVSRADAALYQAKAGGRNLVRLAA